MCSAAIAGSSSHATLLGEMETNCTWQLLQDVRITNASMKESFSVLTNCDREYNQPYRPHILYTIQHRTYLIHVQSCILCGIIITKPL